MIEDKIISPIVRGNSSKLLAVGFKDVTSLNDYACQVQLFDPNNPATPLVDRAITDFNSPSPNNSRFIFRLSATEVNPLPSVDDNSHTITVRMTRTANNPVTEAQVQDLKLRFSLIDGKFV